MTYQLAIKNVVIVPVEFSVADGDKRKKFKFSLECDRLTTEEWKAGITNDEGVITPEKIREQLAGITRGWKGQTFVLDDDGNPAEFCEEAFQVMTNAPGVFDVILESLMKESAAKGKN